MLTSPSHDYRPRKVEDFDKVAAKHGDAISRFLSIMGSRTYPVCHLAKEVDVSRNTLYLWKRIALGKGSATPTNFNVVNFKKVIAAAEVLKARQDASGN
jgi:hypothetical protein